MKNRVGGAFCVLILLLASTTGTSQSLANHGMRSYDEEENGPCWLGNCDPWCIPFISCIR
jgi:hypothetical protein